MSENIIDAIQIIYNEFGLDCHNVPIHIQSQVNAMAKEIIKLRIKKLKK